MQKWSLSILSYCKFGNRKLYNDIPIINNNPDCYKVLLQVKVGTYFSYLSLHFIDGIGGKMPISDNHC